jgi:hypothetical protein
VIVKVTARGKPVPGARVEIRQVRHGFLFDANILEIEPGPATGVRLTR